MATPSISADCNHSNQTSSNSDTADHTTPINDHLNKLESFLEKEGFPVVEVIPHTLPTALDIMNGLHLQCGYIYNVVTTQPRRSIDKGLKFFTPKVEDKTELPSEACRPRLDESSE